VEKVKAATEAAVEKAVLATGRARQSQKTVVKGEVASLHPGPYGSHIYDARWVCSDLPLPSGKKWTDGTNDCSGYAENSHRCHDYGSSDYNGEGPADEHCCACGGGDVAQSCTGQDFRLINSVVENNLGGMGPLSSEMDVRYIDATHDAYGHPVDLLIRNMTKYAPHNASRNGAKGDFGVINVRRHSNVTLNFSFVKTGTVQPATMNDVVFTIYNIDIAKNGFGIQSVIAHPGVSNFWTTADADLEVTQSSKEPANLFSGRGERRVQGGVIFTGTTFGYGDEEIVTTQELNRAATLMYEGAVASSFRISFDVSSTSQDDHSPGGRNFLFHGKNLIPQTTTTTTTSVPDGCTIGTCIIWGDPHIIPFDLQSHHQAQHGRMEAMHRTRNWKSEQVTVTDVGTFWLVRSRRVSIQARFCRNSTHHDVSNLGALAISGPFLQGNTLTIRPLSDKTTWNGREILATMPSEFSNGLVHAKYHKQAEIVKDGTRGVGIDIDLPEGMHLTVNRWKQSLAAIVHMCRPESKIEGQCGNFNGDASDDARLIAGRDGQRTDESEFLFSRPVQF